MCSGVESEIATVLDLLVAFFFEVLVVTDSVSEVDCKLDLVTSLDCKSAL